MTQISVRSMVEKDIDQAAEIHRKVLRKGLTQDTSYNIEELFKASIASNPKTCLVGELDGEVVGFIIGRVKEWSFGVERSGWIELIEVDPAHMGEGIGKTLAKDLIAYFKSEGIGEIYTSVGWDIGDIIAFFKSIGFDKSSFINLKFESD